MMSKRVWRDSRYLRDAQLALALNSDLVGHQVEAFVKDGVIYLKGQARTPAQRTLAARIVSLGRGPFLVRNQIQIAD
jgi:osmotically-inducible protein OsmY